MQNGTTPVVGNGPLWVPQGLKEKGNLSKKKKTIGWLFCFVFKDKGFAQKDKAERKIVLLLGQTKPFRVRGRPKITSG